MLKYPTDQNKLREVRSIEATFRILFEKAGRCTDMDLLIARNLQERYKKLMDWSNQVMLGPIYPTS
jgi:hypothetical protein